MDSRTSEQSVDQPSQGSFFQGCHSWEQRPFQFGSVSAGENFDMTLDLRPVARQSAELSYPSQTRMDSAVPSNENLWNPLSTGSSGRGGTISTSRLNGHFFPTQDSSRIQTFFNEASQGFNAREDDFAVPENTDCSYAQVRADASENGDFPMFETPSQVGQDPLRPLYNVNTMWPSASLSTASETETICSPVYNYEAPLSNSYSELPGPLSFWSPGAPQSIDTLSSISEAPSMSSLQPSVSNIDSEKLASPFSPPQADFVTPAFGQAADFLAIQPSSRRSSFTHTGDVSIEGSAFGSPGQPLFEDLSDPKPMLSPRGVLQRQQAARQVIQFPPVEHCSNMYPTIRISKSVTGKPRPVVSAARHVARSVQDNVSRHERQEDSENGPARDNPLYQAAPQADGLYHCPFEGQEGCAHKPAKLKCNYE
ncbi:hypothetical protein L228DRAFT_121098 [Xylona heveae TC161]|uniref:Uncharacterized protein n=1 Tax=Xylona heveae (strain CBS 132557 / TC161) TaxID=1328760 RepID=A0A165HJZ4_XYLHT|nr:hypothetical protein L228DRAFT_121098 [Xylona heveae TC161]KZF23628.1 hypothetical protein L228DRAFT_121098 [Xylona heveae TC161]